ncbi:hypothetical protein [Paracidovorax avenae]|uniref:hypothetical protein n=1 Tax=Paracidovorax avenae TaxID=80867 RepID=UPI001AD83433|nr:hypothetical protein [Paracidovorax avenae]
MNKIAITFLSSLLLAACSKESSTSANTQKSQASALASAPLANPPTAKTPELKIDKGPWDGPFGLKMGLTDDQLKAAVPDIHAAAANIFSTSSPPKPHDSFETYMLITSASTGLCKITAVGKTIQTSQFGDELRNAHKSLKAALTEKYGQPISDHDFLKHGSMWNESKYWMMGLLKKDRIVATFWERKTDKNPKGADLPNDIDSIIVESSAEGTDAGHITLRYAFTNEDACVDAIKKEKNKAL